MRIVTYFLPDNEELFAHMQNMNRGEVVTSNDVLDLHEMLESDYPLYKKKTPVKRSVSESSHSR